MRKLRPNKTVKIPSDQVTTLDIGTNVSHAEVDALINQGYVVSFQPAWATQRKASDEKCPRAWCTGQGMERDPQRMIAKA